MNQREKNFSHNFNDCLGEHNKPKDCHNSVCDCVWTQTYELLFLPADSSGEKWLAAKWQQRAEDSINFKSLLADRNTGHSLG